MPIDDVVELLERWRSVGGVRRSRVLVDGVRLLAGLTPEERRLVARSLSEAGAPGLADAISVRTGTDVAPQQLHELTGQLLDLDRRQLDELVTSLSQPQERQRLAREAVDRALAGPISGTPPPGAPVEGPAAPDRVSLRQQDLDALPPPGVAARDVGPVATPGSDRDLSGIAGLHAIALGQLPPDDPVLGDLALDHPELQEVGLGSVDLHDIGVYDDISVHEVHLEADPEARPGAGRGTGAAAGSVGHLPAVAVQPDATPVAPTAGGVAAAGTAAGAVAAAATAARVSDVRGEHERTRRSDPGPPSTADDQASHGPGDDGAASVAALAAAPADHGELTPAAPADHGELTAAAPADRGELTAAAPADGAELTAAAPADGADERAARAARLLDELRAASTAPRRFACLRDAALGELEPDASLAALDAVPAGWQRRRLASRLVAAGSLPVDDLDDLFDRFPSRADTVFLAGELVDAGLASPEALTSVLPPQDARRLAARGER